MRHSRPDRPPRREQHSPASDRKRREVADRLRDLQPGESTGLFRLYGRQPVLQVLRLGLVRSLEVARHAHGRAVDGILRLAEARRVPVTRVDSLPEDEGSTLQGVRALAEPPRIRHDLRAFVESLPASPPPLLLMLDGITDPHNLGAILRTAVGAGVDGVIVRERRQAPLTDTVVKVSAGAAYLIPIFEVVNLAQTLRQLAELGFWSVAAVAGEHSRSYREYRWNSPTVLILGAEGSGVSDLLQREADDRIMIPMSGDLESLNVSVASGVILFESAHQRGLRKSPPEQ